MRNIKGAVLLWLICILCTSQLSSQNIGVSGSFVPSTVEECQTSDLTIFFSNEDFVETIMAGDAMITVDFPSTGEYSVPQTPPTGSNSSLFTWTLTDYSWTGMLAGNVGPLSSVEIVFEVTAINVTGGISSELNVILISGMDLNQVNNMANPVLEIVENTTPIVNACPDQDQGTFSCLEQVTEPALTIQEFITLFGNNVLGPNYCGDLIISYTDDTTSMNSGCAMDPIVISRSYKFEDGSSSDSCEVQYTIIDDVSPQVSCKDITIELDENGSYTINPEDLNDGVVNTCNGTSDETITFTVSQPTFDCSDLDVNGQNCANIFAVKLYAEDACGNIDSCDANVTVIDNTAPVISCPSNMTINLEAGECSTQYFYAVPQATDNCDAFAMFSTSTSLTQITGTDLGAGDIYIAGTYTWSYEAVDGCGNVSQCNFSLEVIDFPNDNYLLSLACNDLINVSLNKDCEIEIGADMILEGGPYKCYESYIIEIEGIAGTIITTPGSYTITITDPDTGNNCWSVVNVEDKLPPVVNCQLPFCETETITGEWNSFSDTFSPEASCWNFDTAMLPTNIRYSNIEFSVQVAGSYTFTMTEDAGFDGLASIYSETFNSTDNCNNLIGGDDDFDAIEESEPQFTVMLAPGSYFLVSTSKSQNLTNEFEWTYDGPSSVMIECEYKCFDYSIIANDKSYIPLPEVMDCSDYSIYHSDSFSGSDCEVKIVTRTYVVTDINGLSSQCSVTLDLDPINIQDDIIFPESKVELNCNDGTTPMDIAKKFDIAATVDNSNTEIIENNEGFQYAYLTYIQNGHPQKVDNSVCSIFATYSDQELTGCGIGCDGNSKIIRTWTILDWCSSEVQTFKQTIKSVDQDAPTLETKDISVNTDPWFCVASFEIPAPTNFHDNCDTAPKYRVLGPTGIDIQGDYLTGFSASGVPIGSHTFYYYAYDCCGNGESYPFTVFVIDNTPPIVVAKQDIVISLTNGVLDQNGHAKMYGESVDNGSHDACSSTLKLELRRDSDICNISGNTTYDDDGHLGDSNTDADNGAFVRFCCDDITNATIDVNNDGLNDPGYVKVWVRVWDDGDNDGLFGTIGDNYNEAWVHVKVEDKLDPVITCPLDITIQCDDDYNDLSITGIAQAIGSCGATDVEYEDISTNLNSCDQGKIIRRWNVLGNGNIFCDQNINIENPNFSIPSVSFANVGNFDAVGCPDMISVGEPTWNSASCDNIAYTVSTDTFKFEDGACYKLLREYTVINWCIYDPSNPQWVETSDFSDGIVNHIQVIKVSDDTKPEITSCEDQMFEVNDHQDSDNDGVLCEAKLTLSNIATDIGSANCPTGWLKWEVIIDLWSDGNEDFEYSSFLPSFDNNFNDTNGNNIPDKYLSPTISGEQVAVELPDVPGSMSNHTVRWKVSDGCGNITQCSNTFMVTDKKAPTPYCIDISSVVMESSSMLELWAIDFNIGSFDNCTLSEDLSYTFSDTPPSNDVDFDPVQNSSKKVFDCDDVLNSPLDLSMYVWDEKGNFDFCVVSLSLIDNSGACGDGMKISGTVATEYGQKASGIEISLNSFLPEYPRIETTNIDGSYSFSGIPINADYEISANNNNNYLNGVSTLDLVKIQRHVLGLEELDSPYKLIAADVNNDYMLKANDLLMLRKLILGIITEFPNNDSWKFVEASQVLDMEVDLQDISYTKNILNLQNDVENIDLVAVKIGDVSENANFKTEAQINTRSSEELLFQFEDRYVKEGEEVQCEISCNNFTDILGFQFTLSLRDLSFTKIESGKIVIGTDNIGIHDENLISVSYNSTTAMSSENNSGLFTLNLKAKKEGSISEMLFINSKITSSEGYVEKSSGEIETTSLRLGAIDESSKSTTNNLYQNAPNPFNESTIIGFELDEKESVKFIIQDYSGRIVKNNTIQGKKGYNQIILNSNEFSSKGIFIYKIESSKFTNSKKMIIVE